MAEDQNSEMLVRSTNRLLKAFRIFYPDDVSNSSTPSILKEYTGSYSQTELAHLVGFSKDQQVQRQQEGNALFGSLLASISHTANATEKLKNLKDASFEIPLASIVLVSSIISPNDMQTDLISVNCTDATMDSATKTAIGELLTEFFNNKLNYGQMLTRYVKLALIDKGAHGVLVLPQGANRVLSTVADMWNPAKNAGLESFAVEANNLCKENLAANKEFIAEITPMISEALESFDPGTESIKWDKRQLTSELAKVSTKILEEKGDALFVTRKLSEVQRGSYGNKKALSDLMDFADKSVSGANPLTDRKGERPKDPIFAISDIFDQMHEEDDMPSVIEFPTEAIIPVIVPGSPHDHLGYFLVFGDDGYPLRMGASFNPGSGVASVERLAYNAMRASFGNQTFQTLTNTVKMSTDSQMDLSAGIFSVAVRHMLESKLEKMGLHGLDVSLHSAIGKNIFFNLMRDSKIKMVFVPEPMFMYYAFDYREDGTGKSILEDIEYVLALRAAFVAAGTMAAMENATRHLNVEVSVDEQHQNAMQTFEIARRNIVSKYSPRFSTNLQQTAESILNSHIHIKAKDQNGTSNNLDVTSENAQRTVPTPDSTWIDTMNNWAGLGLFVSPSVLNQLSENEYSRSIATTNICYANRVRMWQNSLYPTNSKFVRNYVRNHPGLLGQLREILGGTTSESTELKTAQVTGEIDTSKNTLDDQLKRVLATLEIVLPKPNVSTDKAHYEEIRNYMDMVDNLTQKIYPDDIGMTDEEKKMVAMLRGAMNSKLIQEFMNDLGHHHFADIPEVDDAVTKIAARTSLALKNLSRKMLILEKLANKKGGEETTF